MSAAGATCRGSFPVILRSLASSRSETVASALAGVEEKARDEAKAEGRGKWLQVAGVGRAVRVAVLSVLSERFMLVEVGFE